ncbi:natural cytotoxicity triggering receptor 3 ligand 1-like [Pristis pectinata]|uniref:natural cytotoxicity triggering receptor 3 ligand 1-like n=1 Tax=Pristis pectinata TaxID=685728 RepID=UPI00223D1EC0|nr:natural cytotoxicity triggering receptor 3 ligand 1-like [Pristis pectinata]
MLTYLYLCVLRIINEVAPMTVSQLPETSGVMAGADITFQCETSEIPNKSSLKVIWWKLGDQDVLQPGSYSRKQFSPLENGKSFFQILDVRVADSGVYYCGVVHAENAIVNGTGSNLVVHASPEPVSILSKASGTNSSNLSLVCQTAEFYPESLTFTWYKNDNNIVNGISISKELNSDGTYQASSRLETLQPAGSGAVYTCVVSHLTLQSPALAVYFDASSNSDKENTSFFLLVSGCTLSALICIVVVVFSLRNCQVSNCKDHERKS